MNVLRYSKRHRYIKTETAVKLMHVAYCKFYDRFCFVIWPLSCRMWHYWSCYNWIPEN